MAINPVSAVGPAEQTMSVPADPRVQQAQAPEGAGHSFESGSGTSSESESHRPSATPASSELPQDEVQLLRDQQTNGDVVIKYLDASGNLVLQVPDAEVLNLARSITEEFAAKARTGSDVTSSEGISSDGGGAHHGH